ncbi:MAG: hypothetical protein Aurels2KO_34440 [Aureliella sp.]
MDGTSPTDEPSISLDTTQQVSDATTSAATDSAASTDEVPEPTDEALESTTQMDLVSAVPAESLDTSTEHFGADTARDGSTLDGAAIEDESLGDTAAEEAVPDADAEVLAGDNAQAEPFESEEMKDDEKDDSLSEPADAQQEQEIDGEFEEVEALTNQEPIDDEVDFATDDEVEQFIDAHRNAALSSGWNLGTAARVLGLAATILIAALGGYMLWPTSPTETVANRADSALSTETLSAEGSGGTESAPQGPPAASSDMPMEPEANVGGRVANQDPFEASLGAAMGRNRSLPSTSSPSVQGEPAYAAATTSSDDAVPPAPQLEIDSAPDNMLAMSSPASGDISSSLPPTLSDATPFGAGSRRAAPPSEPIMPKAGSSDAAIPDAQPMSLPDLSREDTPELELPPAPSDVARAAPMQSSPIVSAPAESAAPPKGAGDFSALPDLPEVPDSSAQPQPQSQPPQVQPYAQPAPDLPADLPSQPEPRSRRSVPAPQTAADPARKSPPIGPALSNQDIDQLLPEPQQQPEDEGGLIDGKHFVFYSEAWQADELPGAVESIAPLIGFGRPRLPKQIVAPVGSLELRGENAEAVAMEIARALPKAALAQRPPKNGESGSQMLVAFVSDVEADAVVRALSVQRRKRLSAAWLRPSNLGRSQKAILVLRGLTSTPGEQSDSGQ